MTDVFISYKRRMRPRVEAIAAALRALGLTVWYDASLEAGSSFSAEISAQVRSAGCVLVCWTEDAFPHGGDTSGWVLGEATISRERGRLVPVLLEATSLDPPWNTIHTESLMGWSPDGGDQTAWQRVLAAIGQHVGRPDLAAGVPDAVAPPKQPGPSRPAIAIAALASAVLTALGSALLAGVDPGLAGGYPELGVGAALAAVPIAGVFWRTGALTLPKAAALVAAFVVAFALGAFLGIQAIQSLRTDPARYDLAEIVVCAIGGFVGGGLSLAAFPVLGLVARGRAVWIRIFGASVMLSAIAALIAAMPFFSLVVSNSAIVWLAAIWQLAYAPALVFAIRPPRKMV